MGWAEPQIDGMSFGWLVHQRLEAQLDLDVRPCVNRADFYREDEDLRPLTLRNPGVEDHVLESPTKSHRTAQKPASVAAQMAIGLSSLGTSRIGLGTYCHDRRNE